MKALYIIVFDLISLSKLIVSGILADVVWTFFIEKKFPFYVRIPIAGSREVCTSRQSYITDLSQLSKYAYIQLFNATSAPDLTTIAFCGRELQIGN